MKFAHHAFFIAENLVYLFIVAEALPRSSLKMWEAIRIRPKSRALYSSLKKSYYPTRSPSYRQKRAERRLSSIAYVFLFFF